MISIGPLLNNNKNWLMFIQAIIAGWTVFHSQVLVVVMWSVGLLWRENFIYFWTWPLSWVIWPVAFPSSSIVQFVFKMFPFNFIAPIPNQMLWFYETILWPHIGEFSDVYVEKKIFPCWVLTCTNFVQNAYVVHWSTLKSPTPQGSLSPSPVLSATLFQKSG